ncbi:hypothetical protein [Prosthecobacter fluviatilis]|uniref:Uncharacterized protein n=1 Tax=Prosthecobacter fluviatilis TaxID=445931 RepID=A0ABW0KRK1_9BACT
MRAEGEGAGKNPKLSETKDHDEDEQVGTDGGLFLINLCKKPEDSMLEEGEVLSQLGKNIKILRINHKIVFL